MQTSTLYFDQFELDLNSYQLRRSGRVIKLEKLPMELLILLAEKQGQLVTREQIIQRLWGDNVFVDTRQGINTAVRKLRIALHDDSEHPRILLTVSRRGYRFIAPLRQIDAPESATLPVSASDDPVLVIPEAPGGKPAEIPVERAYRWSIFIGALVFIIALTAAVYLARRHGSANEKATAPQIKSLAVLPLENLSADKDSDYYAEGMTDELITQLAKISGVRIISRTSVMPFEGKRKPLEEIARALDVDAVVEGTVLRSGGRVRVTTQLIQVNPEKHLWAESYEREERDVLHLQADLAEDIARQISASITPGERTIVPVNVEAHEAYLRGRYWWHRRGTEAEAEGLRYFERAVEIDPSYAAGWAGVADSYVVMAHHGGLPPNEAMPKAKEAALKALDLDDSLAEAHASLAMIKLSYDWDYSGAEREFKRAIELDPNYATAHHWYAHYLVVAGRFDEALKEIQLAHQLDPYSATINAWWGLIYYYEGQYERAAAQLNSMLELDPALGPAVYESLARVYEQQGNYELAVEERERLFSAEGRPQDGAALARAFSSGGPEAYWRERLSLLQQATDNGTGPGLTLALIHSHLRHRDETLGSLERAYQEHIPWLTFMGREPGFEWLRAEPRFVELEHRVGLISFAGF